MFLLHGKLVSDAKLKAEALNQQFQSVFTKETKFNAFPPLRDFPGMSDIDITVPGVLKLVKNLKPA